MRAAMGGNLGALQCTHPRSDVRVQMLEEELQVPACCCKHEATMHAYIYFYSCSSSEPAAAWLRLEAP